MAKKGKYVNFVTPKGVARYCKIVEGDHGHEFSDGKHKTELVFTAEDHKVFKKAALAAAKELGAPAKIPERKAIDKQTKEEVISFIFKSTKLPVIVDAKRNRINPKTIGSGSVLKLGGTFAAYPKTGPLKGVTAYLDAVQVIELKEGFDATKLFNDEDGYDGSQADADESGFADETEDEAMDL